MEDVDWKNEHKIGVLWRAVGNGSDDDDDDDDDDDKSEKKLWDFRKQSEESVNSEKSVR